MELIGEMEESGFRDRQWLARRGDRFVQLSELLYRVAEEVDGGSTHEEMAERLTRSTDWAFTAENVRQIAQSKLVPLGILAPEDGEAQGVRSGGKGASPLGVNARKELLGPGVIDPIMGALQGLFHPFALVPILAVAALAQAWAFLAHGVGGALREVIYAPGLILVVLGILLVSGVVHEFGHAAALRYGGGKVRGMGAGLYLVYPVLYTDTTDAYRLGRWAKVRTDLGGFYFHLIFALGLVCLYWATGGEFLLLAVLMIDMGILYQCLPFVRFDGYWALADLTGIPDFFSQMGAFLRSVIPLKRWRGARLPELKPWVKAVFVLYVATTIPVLALLLYFLITRLPVTVAVAWHSLTLLAGEFSLALGVGDLVGMASSGLQALILSLQLLGIVYLLYALGRTLTVVLLRRLGRLRDGTAVGARAE
ncbi:hypothetical protein GBA65_20795 [Rubrobacter marinus]|uniref:Peptide zinc metalloprotease protein n=1 Tax=Rubrobacter marinus TaxID=2653852 RepID=A0A6G8Q238_9ACTN|nr:hypothetical protein [Rubrobacter marinus]QIN80542.1 hypothetical protein GBA65_20795 [Rubrobacter marinus]